MSGWIVEVAGRTDEMSHRKMSLAVFIQQDGDIIVEIHEDGTYSG